MSNFKKGISIKVPLDLVKLDEKNPRLYANSNLSEGEYDENKLINTIYRESKLNELAKSMVSNGYFEEEPIIIVPDIDTSEIKDMDNDEFNSFLKNGIQHKTLFFKVIEGNRRVSTAKLLTSPDLRSLLKIRDTFPSIKNSRLEEDLNVLPSIAYRERRDVYNYLGVKHIIGTRKWGAFPKAKFIHLKINDEMSNNQLNFSTAVENVQSEIGDSTRTVKGLYFSYQLFQEISEKIEDLYTEPIVKQFSLFYNLLFYVNIRKFIGIENYPNITFGEPIIKNERDYENLNKVLKWVFGNDVEPPVIKESRDFKNLAKILDNKNATKLLCDTDNFQEAFTISGGEEIHIIKELETVKLKLRDILSRIYTQRGNVDVEEKIDECSDLMSEVKDSFNRNKN